MEAEGNAPTTQLTTVRDSRVPEHADTKSVADSKSPLRHDIVTFVKWRPFGRSNNRRIVEWVPLMAILRSREPVSLGDVEGAFHPSTPRSGP